MGNARRHILTGGERVKKKLQHAYYRSVMNANRVQEMETKHLLKSFNSFVRSFVQNHHPFAFLQGVLECM